MRTPAIALTGTLAVMFGFSLAVLAQHAPPPPGWPLCPRCQGPQDRTAAREKEKIDGHAFDPHNLDGVWGNNGIELDVKNVPPFTAWGYEQYQATRAADSPLGIPLSNSKDPMMRCDPLGYPRLFAYNYGFEFLQEKDRVVQFFEWGHNWRTIWTDGRKLPDDPPEPRWMGYAVGHWEGDVFKVESNGYDDRSWLTEDRRDRRWGFPHSDQLRVEETYRRTSYGTLEASITIIDPKVFKKPWTTAGKINLSAGAELGEYLCVPSDNDLFNEQYVFPAAGGGKQ
jgi:hypothetical protein